MKNKRILFIDSFGLDYSSGLDITGEDNNNYYYRDYCGTIKRVVKTGKDIEYIILGEKRASNCN